MRGAGADVFGNPDEAAQAVRLGGIVTLAATLVGVVLAVGISRWPREDNLPLLVLLAVVSASGVVAVRAPDRMPPYLVVATLLTSTCAISAGMVIVGGPAVDGSDNEMLLLVPVLYSAYFCRPWVTALVCATASVTYGAALHLSSALAPASRWVTTTFALVAVGVLVTLVRLRDGRRMTAANAEAGRDPLTGLLNRRGLAARSETALSGPLPISVLVADIDHFKAVNDRHGHAVGDQVLVRVAAQLRSGSRADDLVVRLGGEEFALVLPGCDAVQVRERAESLRRAVIEASATWPAPVTLSVGTTTTSTTPPDVSLLLAAADRALYQAKAGGRNTVRAS